MIAMCLKVVGMVALNEELSWQMIESNSLITCLEDGGLLHPVMLLYYMYIIVQSWIIG